MVKGILIDMGETVVHNGDMNFSNALNTIYSLSKDANIKKEKFVEEGLLFLNEVFKNRKYLEFRMIDFLQILINQYNLKIDKSINEIEEIFALSSSVVTFVDNIVEILEYFKSKKYPIVMLSNTSFSKNVVCKMLGNLEKYFDEIIVSSECVFRKPHKNFFDYGISKFDDVEDIYYIGNDFYYDVYGSFNSNLKSIWFNEVQAEVDKNYKVDDFIEITNYKELIEMDF